MPVGLHIPGQLCELLPPAGGLPAGGAPPALPGGGGALAGRPAGAVLVRAGGAVDVVLLEEELDVAALAIAVPPPATTPVTAKAVSRGLARISHLLCAGLTAQTILWRRRSPVGGE